jgi:YkoY family integral membrane protein
MGIFDCVFQAPTLLASIELFTQRIEAADVGVIAVLIVLEGVLSIDNALVLGLLARRLPKHQQKKALTYGLVGAFVFRLVAIFTATILLRLPIMKLLGGVYLLYVAIKHFVVESRDPTREHVKVGPDGHPVLHDARTGMEIPEAEHEQEIAERSPLHVTPAMSTTATVVAVAMFWPTVAVIELTDIAFAIDSILAAIAFIPPATQTPNPKLWVVVTGGMLGVILMRFAAVVFIKLLERFPRFELSAYLLVIVIGLKLSLDWLVNSYLYPRPADWPMSKPYHGPLDFHNFTSPAFIVFWVLMALCFCVGFLPQRGEHEEPTPS